MAVHVETTGSITDGIANLLLREDDIFPVRSCRVCLVKGEAEKACSETLKTPIVAGLQCCRLCVGKGSNIYVQYIIATALVRQATAAPAPATAAAAAAAAAARCSSPNATTATRTAAAAPRACHGSSTACAEFVDKH